MTQQNSEFNSKQRYRVVLIHPSAGVKQSGGAQVVAIELARRLSAYFDVELLSGASCGPWSYPIPCLPRTQAHSVLQHPLLKPIFANLTTHPEIILEHLTSFFPCFVRLLHQPADLLFPHNDYGGLAVASCVRLLTGSPVLFTEHNGLLANGKCLSRNLRFRPDHLVVFDEKTAQFTKASNSAQPLSVIPNGVDLEQFSPDGTHVDFGLKKPIVLCVASLNRRNHKRVELALQAVSRLPDVSLLICGDGPDRLYFQSLGNELLGEERFAIHTIPFQRMPEVYRSVDVFTLPAANEPFGLVYLEAMASGVPVVAPDDEMRRYLIDQGGLLCDVTNPDIYASTIKQALNTSWEDRPRQNASRFSWDVVTLQYRDLIEKMIQRSPRNLSKIDRSSQNSPTI